MEPKQAHQKRKQTVPGGHFCMICLPVVEDLSWLKYFNHHEESTSRPGLDCDLTDVCGSASVHVCAWRAELI